MRKRISNVPTGPSLYDCESTEPLFAFFQFLQDAKRRDRRREAVLAGFDELRAAGDLDIEEQGPSAPNDAFAQKFIGYCFRRGSTRNLDVIVCFSVCGGRM